MDPDTLDVDHYGPRPQTVTLAGIAAAAFQKHGPESRAALASIRKKLERDWRKDTAFDGASAEDHRRASEELHWNLKNCMLDRRALAQK